MACAQPFLERETAIPRNGRVRRSCQARGAGPHAHRREPGLRTARRGEGVRRYAAAAEGGGASRRQQGGRRTSRSAFAVRRSASVRVPLRSARPRSGRVADNPSLQSIERMKVGERPVCLTIRPGSSSASTSTGYRVLPSIGAGARIKTRRGTNATGWFADEAPRLAAAWWTSLRRRGAGT